MDREDYHDIKQIFLAAIEVPPEERSSFLEANCSGDHELRREVERLLDSYDTEYLETPAVAGIAEMVIREDFENDPKKTAPDGEIGGGSGEVASELPADTTFSHFRIISRIGAGGMGVVYLAEDTRLDRKVAVKFLTETFVREGNNLNRFFREAKSSSALNHPNIITVYEIGEFENRPFIATEFIEGLTLKEHLKTKSPTLGVILDIAIQIASALSTAHRAGIIHRDIKSDNVMIRSDGIVKVLDFGLAKYASSDVREEAKTRTQVSSVHGMVMGTPQFMSPEQARGIEVDARTDIWSFGVLLYQMLTQNLPFYGDTAFDVVASILKSEPPPLSRYVPDISPELEKITLKTLRKNREERYQTIDGLLSELKTFRRDMETADTTVPGYYRFSSPDEYEKNTEGSLVRTTAKGVFARSGNLGSIISQTFGKVRAFPVLSTLLAVAVVSLAVLGIGVWQLRTNDREIKSVAIRPFRSIDQNEDNNALSFGLADALSTKLSNVGELKVILANSASRYADLDKESTEIGKDLGVDGIFEGTLQRANGKLRVTLRLIRISDGAQIWGDSFEEFETNIFGLQNALASRTANALAVRLNPEETRPPTENLEAYNLFLKGEYVLRQRGALHAGGPEQFFRQAIALDPNFARAWAGLAGNMAMGEADRVAEAEVAVDKALALDPELADAHAVRGFIRMFHYFDWPAAEMSLDRALELDPNSIEANHWRGVYLSFRGRFNEAKAAMYRAQELDPLNLTITADIGQLHYFAREYAQAEEWCKKALAIDPNHGRSFGNLHNIYSMQGRYDEAFDHYVKGLKFHPPEAELPAVEILKDRYKIGGWGAIYQKDNEISLAEIRDGLAPRNEWSLRYFSLASRYLYLGEKDKAFEAADRMMELRLKFDRAHFSLAYLKVDPRFDSVRDDPRFHELLRKLNF